MPARRLVAGLSLAVLGDVGIALAQTNPGGAPAASQEGLSVAIEQAVLQEANPLQARPGLPTSPDTASISILDGAYRHGWGRQRLVGFGRLASTHYANEGALDHQAYRVGARLDLETAADLGARLSWQRQQDALEGQLRLDPSTGERRVQTFEQRGAAFQWGVQRAWSLEAQWQREELQPNRPQTWWLGYGQDTWRLLARGDFAQTLFWSLGRRLLQGTQAAVVTPSGASPEVDYRLAVWDAEWSWVPRPGDGWTLRMSTGRGQRRWLLSAAGAQAQAMADSLPQASTESAIHSLQTEVRWRPVVPWSLNLAASRDRGQQSQGYEAGIGEAGFLLQGANEVRQARVGVQWDLGFRLQLRLDWHVIDRLGSQSWLFGINQPWLPTPMLRWRDRLDRRSLGLSWDLTNRVTARCVVRRELRSGRGFDDEWSGQDPDLVLWRDRQWQCSLRWRLR